MVGSPHPIIRDKRRGAEIRIPRESVGSLYAGSLFELSRDQTAYPQHQHFLKRAQ